MTPTLRQIFLCLPLVIATDLAAQTRDTPTPPAARCPAPAELGASDLYGLWRLTLWTEGGSEQDPVSIGALLLEPHPEYPGSVRGRLRRPGPGPDLEAQVAGDVTDEGEFNLDESADGVTMDAVWTGEPVDCGRTIRGQRRPAEGQSSDTPVLQFSLQRISDRR